MRLIKFAAVSIFFFAGILLLVSLLIPAHIRLSKAVSISPSDSVLQYVRRTAQWPRWHPLFKEKAAQAWLQKNGAQLQLLADTDSLVVMAWMQPGKTPVTNGWQLHLAGDSAVLQWYMDFRLRWYPWQKFGSLLYESTYGRMMEQGLQNLQALARKQ